MTATSPVSDHIILYGYWRSSSAYRVRIALNLKGLEYEQRAVHLVRDGGEQRSEAYRRLNPLGLVPSLVHGEHVVTQSLAICEYLEEVFPEPALLPGSARDRARIRTIAQSIACEIQPLNNLAVLNYVRNSLNAGEAGTDGWYRHWIARGFEAIETWLSQPASSGEFCHGDSPTLADCLLVPQVYNAERFACDLGPYPHIRRVTANCRELEAFANAAPERQPDAE